MGCILNEIFLFFNFLLVRYQSCIHTLERQSLMTHKVKGIGCYF